MDKNIVKPKTIFGLSLLEVMISASIALLVFIFVMGILSRLYKEYKFSIDYSYKIRQAAVVLNALENDLRGRTSYINPSETVLANAPFSAVDQSFALQTNLFGTSPVEIGYAVNRSDNRLTRIIYDGYPVIKTQSYLADNIKNLTIQLITLTGGAQYYNIEIEIYLNRADNLTFKLTNKVFIRR